MGERLRRSLQQRNTRETWAGPRKGKNPGESPELSKTPSRSEDHQENAPASAGREEKPQTEAWRPSRKDQGLSNNDNPRAWSSAM